MKNFKFFPVLFLALLLAACSDIDGLNDYNAVFSFEITEHKGTDGEIVIGEPVMAGNTIRIPVLHGIHNFPLYFKGQPHFENPIDRVTGLDFNDWIEIDLERGGESGNEPVLDENGNYIFQEPKFYVQALSGMPREYTFKIDYTATSSDAEIFPQVTFAEVPEGSIVADLLTVTDSDVPEEGNMVLANIVAPQFPLTLTPNSASATEPHSKATALRRTNSVRRTSGTASRWWPATVRKNGGRSVWPSSRSSMPTAPRWTKPPSRSPTWRDSPPNRAVKVSLSRSTASPHPPASQVPEPPRLPNRPKRQRSPAREETPCKKRPSGTAAPQRQTHRPPIRSNSISTPPPARRSPSASTWRYPFPTAYRSSAM